MKTIAIIFIGTVLATGSLVSQEHIAPCSGSQDHTGGICYGYATGRAAGRSAGYSQCNPLTFYQSTINSQKTRRNSGQVTPAGIYLSVEETTLLRWCS